jgi:hypothetical protein
MTTATANLTDDQAAQAMLDSAPSMLWRRARHADGRDFAVHFNGCGWDVILFVGGGYAISVWDAAHFDARFTVTEYLDAGMSAALDRTLFQAQLDGSLQVVDVD